MPVQYKDYYQTLGVAKSASQDDIRKAFRKLAREYHPDVAKYDTLGADWERGGGFQPPPGWGAGQAGRGGMPGGFGGGDFSFGGTGFSDFFEQFFGGRSFKRHAGANPFSGFGYEEETRGSDIEGDLLVTIEEALGGTRKKISFRRGDDPKVETFEVKIPKGVREGQRIRLAGQGHAGGDLYLRVRFAQHPDYRIEGSDLIYDLEIPAWKAVLGSEADVSTPDGAARLKIPPGTQPGSKFRIKGRGLPTGPTSRGDFYVVVQITLPKTLSASERSHWEAIAGLHGDGCGQGSPGPSGTPIRSGTAPRRGSPPPFRLTLSLRPPFRP
jgi:curved DNA-binding protein